MTGSALIIQGDALHLPLPDASVDLVVSSPPYWSLRSYSAGPGEIGSEATPTEYLEALWAATAEFMRVLKPTGSAFIDLGDKYAGGGQGGPPSASSTLRGNGHVGGGPKLAALDQAGGRKPTGVPAKSLMLLPERYRVGCVDRLGLIARAVIVWDKPNGLPESVTDRVRRSHEDWVHLTKEPRYYSATDEIREAYAPASMDRYASPGGLKSAIGNGAHPSKIGKQRLDGDNLDGWTGNPLGKLPGSVWSIPSEPLRLPDHLGVQHYAAFPSEWPRRLILGFSPHAICLACGHGRVPVAERRYRDVPGGSSMAKANCTEWRDAGVRGAGLEGRAATEATILGYGCPCAPFTDHPGSGDTYFRGSGRPTRGLAVESRSPIPHVARGDDGPVPRTGPWREWHLQGWTPPPTRPAIILDPFSGTGTTPMVARALGRIGVGVDLSHAYCRAARWRVRHDGAKAISRTNLERQGQLL